MYYDFAVPIVIQLFWPIIAVPVSGMLLRSALHQPIKTHGWRALAGLLLLALTCYWGFHLASLGLFVTILTYFLGFLIAGVTVIGLVWFLWAGKRRDRISAVMGGGVFLALLFASIHVGEAQSPENITGRNADQVIEALNRYEIDVGAFPEKLDQLTPKYLQTLPYAATTQGTGWLYNSTTSDFTLAYWYGAEKMGASVCLYRSTTKKWNCAFNNWGSFQEVPTPGPSRI